jgi:hypothetical protein
MDIYILYPFVTKVIKYICKTPALSQFLNNVSTQVDFLLDQFKTPIYQWCSKEMANFASETQILGTERFKKVIG